MANLIVNLVIALLHLLIFALIANPTREQAYMFFAIVYSIHAAGDYVSRTVIKTMEQMLRSYLSKTIAIIKEEK